MEGTRQKVP